MFLVLFGFWEEQSPRTWHSHLRLYFLWCHFFLHEDFSVDIFLLCVIYRWIFNFSTEISLLALISRYTWWMWTLAKNSSFWKCRDFLPLLPPLIYLSGVLCFNSIFNMDFNLAILRLFIIRRKFTALVYHHPFNQCVPLCLSISDILCLWKIYGLWPMVLI